ncbi:putative lipoprotein [Gibbsiella quercinecans]|uniref:Glycoprotein-polysaccharide metabolism protein n=1 Tax=Gibbsiella quercinecans TaxID=929813 RepID=A0A250AZ52_9GAMM|nr:YbaY family lipoprotein [Gibbsiella quercinecans]ATA18982.1 glycoprotein-polysaccharide metabolism protein [Gibbsiella quercinecans]RLM03308.1 glycoprotein-polysaccharide metabolism protein [Gibbsiella quercinecans]RLM11567.1 glycoprotein-polysaccharide metabolism protein [Gibbsiella quercinecans]TCT81346.1 putative lipoprotein [Gibbsiella quercinecans]
MKLWQLTSGAALLAIALAGCAQKSGDVPTPTPGSPATPQQLQIRGPAVTGTVNIRQRVALPPDAVLTVTLSDASVSDAPSKVIAQRVIRTEGQQAPFTFVVPFNPADIQPNARIILSAAITVNGQMTFITDTIQQVLNRNGARADLLLVPVQNVPVQGTLTNQP